MDTVTDVIFYCGNFSTGRINRCTAAIDSLLLDWENRFSADRFDSEVYNVNHRTADTLTVSDEFYHLVSVALAYGDSLDGKFDITISPLKEFWNPGCSDCADPDPLDEAVQEKVDSLIQMVDYKAITLMNNNRLAFENRFVKIDLGGVVKGRVIREMEKLFDSHGLKNYLICSGGDILVHGTKADGSFFRVGVQDPRSKELAALFTLEKGSVVTSGDYERYRISKSGERVHHLFDPSTGYSSKLNSSVTVVGQDPILVDILSTALFLLPSEEIVTYINGRPDLECMVITADNKTLYSSGFVNELEKNSTELK